MEKINKEKKRGNKSTLDSLILIFFTYAAIGWIVEVVWCFLVDGTLANRGFLHIPILPIYGFGGVLFTIIFERSKFKTWINVLLCALVATVLEYFTSYILETIYNTRWWDYSGQVLNLNGRICLLNSMLFIVFGYLIARYLSPTLNKLILEMPKWLRYTICTILMILLITDFVLSIIFPHIGFGITN